MFYKSLMLVMVFIMAFEISTTIARDKPCKCPCDCIKLVAKAVDDVIAIQYCDLYGLWEVPNKLKDQLKNLQECCSTSEKQTKSKTSEIVDEMLETICKSIVGESQTLNGKTIVVYEPAPDCAVEALCNVHNLLLYGCPTQVIE